MGKNSGINSYLWKIDKFACLSSDSRVGAEGAFRYGVGLDVRNDSGLLKVAPKPVKDSGSSITKLTTAFDFNPSTLDLYGYAEDTIYKRQYSNGAYTTARALTGDSPNGQGLAHFNGKLFFAKDTNLGHFDYAATWTENFQTNLTSARWHPMCRIKNLLLVGHGRYVASVDDLLAYTQKRLTLPPDYYVRSIFRIGSSVAILATYGANVTDSDEGMLFLWNGISETYNGFIPLNGNPHAGIAQNNRMVVIVGSEPRVEESLGGEFQDYEESSKIPDVGIGKTAEVYPNAIELWRKLVHFGISAGTSTSVVRGLYTWGASKNTNRTRGLNVDYPTSQGTVVGTGVQITAVKKVGTTIFFAWKDGASYGWDKIDTTLLQASATYRSLVFDNKTPFEKVGNKLLIEFAKDLATNESVIAKISVEPYDDPTFIDTATYVTGTANTAGDKVLEIPLVVSIPPIRSRDLHLELTLGGTAATKPEVKRILTQFDEDADQL